MPRAFPRSAASHEPPTPTESAMPAAGGSYREDPVTGERVLVGRTVQPDGRIVRGDAPAPGATEQSFEG